MLIGISKSHNNWHLSDEDKKIIDKLEEKNILLNNQKRASVTRLLFTQQPYSVQDKEM